MNRQKKHVKGRNHPLNQSIKGNNQQVLPGTDTCICCGSPIPEGRMVCPTCQMVYGLYDRD